MNNIEFLTIDNYPNLNVKDMTITTEFYINPEENISISINNADILDKLDIQDIQDNIIYLSKDIDLNKGDEIVVIYNKQDI